jgi:hypothetical protein
MPRTGFNLADVRMWLEIDGEEVDISHASLSFALNTIPTARFVLATGVRAKTGVISKAMELAETTQLLIPGKVFLQGNQGAVSERGTLQLNGRYQLFDGYVTGINGHIGGGLNLQATMTHWLSDLNYSSAISAGSSPENPWQFSFNAALHPAIGGETPTGHFLPVTMVQQNIGQEEVQRDLWGEAILPWLKELASEDRINLQEFGRNDTPNKDVQRALDRFAGDKLPLQLGDVDYVDVARAISEDIAGTLDPNTNSNHLMALANTTIWDKLIGELSPLYRFAVVPFPTKAKVVPFTAGLRTTWRNMLNRDETSVDLSTQLIRPLGGLGIYGSFDSGVGAFLPGESTPPELHIGGQFVAKNQNGMILLKRAPRWLDSVILPSVVSTGIIGGSAVADGMLPNAGEAPPSTAVTRAKAVKNAFDQMAQSMFIDEVLRHRVGLVVTPLRFDICPGSMITFQGHNSTGKRGIRHGTVIAVSYTVDAEQRSATTVYNVAHVRKDSENKDDDFSLDRHPLYDRVWAGDQLIEPT